MKSVTFADALIRYNAPPFAKTLLFRVGRKKMTEIFRTGRPKIQLFITNCNNFCSRKFVTKFKRSKAFAKFENFKFLLTLWRLNA